MDDNNGRTEGSDSDNSDNRLEVRDILNVIRILRSQRRRNHLMPQHNIGLRGHEYIIGILNGHPKNCKDMFRLEVSTFRALCKALRNHNLLHDSRKEVMVEEAMGMFCLLVGHENVHQVVGDRFQHSTQTINKYVRQVIKALCKVGRHLIVPTHRDNMHPYISTNHRNYPWFKGFIGAMDGTMMKAVVPAELREAYHNRLGQVSQNVLAIVDFDMKFIFIYTGWEDSAHDAHVLHHAASDSQVRFPWPPEGQYYLVDSAYPCTTGLLPPYSRERYHMSDQHNQREFQGYKDYFNYRHSTIRNIIEQTFGVIKERFKIFEVMLGYSVGRQGLITTMCCALHNFIRTVTPDDWIFENSSKFQLPPIELEDGDEASSSHNIDMSNEASHAMAAIRDEIAISMWEARDGN